MVQDNCNLHDFLEATSLDSDVTVGAKYRIEEVIRNQDGIQVAYVIFGDSTFAKHVRVGSTSFVRKPPELQKDFQFALNALKNGMPMTRFAWGASVISLDLRVPQFMQFTQGQPHAEWLPTVEDLLATDWTIHMEAFLKMGESLTKGEGNAVH